MSSPHDPHGSELRRVRTETGCDEGLADAILYYGLSQVLVLTAPMLWFIFQSPVQRFDLVTGTVVALICLPVVIGLRRLEILSIGRSWPKINDVTLGLGGGYRAYLSRGVFLSSVIGIAAYGAAAIGTLTTGVLPVIVVALASVVAGGLVYPYAYGTDRQSRAVRFGLYVPALIGAFHFGAPYTLEVGFSSAVVLYPLLIGLGLLDAVL